MSPLLYGPLDNKGLIGLPKTTSQICVILALQSTQNRRSLPFLQSETRRLIRTTLRSIERGLSRFHLRLCFHFPGTNETSKLHLERRSQFDSNFVSLRSQAFEFTGFRVDYAV